MKLALVALALIVVLAAAALLPVRPYLDFQVIYHADLGLLRGISLYDHAGQVGMLAELAGVPTGQVFVLPFPYPPWYALSTLWLARLSIDLAARAWFGLNLLLFFLSMWLLTEALPAAKRAVLLAAGLLWLPVLGSLFVGQYGFPVLLGAALMIHALRRENALLVACAAALLTFKPHLGGPVVVLAFIKLAQRRDRVGRDALLATLSAGVILFGLGFLASPNWPVNYVRSLTAFGSLGGVSQCTQCVSLSTALVRLAGGGLQEAVGIAAVIAGLCCAWLVLRWRQVASTPGGLAAVCILIIMLVSPYLQNYDYLLLLVPFIELALGTRSALEWIGVALAYALPFVGLGLLGTAGNGSLILSACILSALVARSVTPRVVITATGA
ncbi:MAG: glycosyltransferase family 87 protein [Chloroflexota bacterium]